MLGRFGWMTLVSRWLLRDLTLSLDHWRWCLHLRLLVPKLDVISIAEVLRRCSCHVEEGLGNRLVERLEGAGGPGTISCVSDLRTDPLLLVGIEGLAV